MRVLFIYPRSLHPNVSVGGVAECLYALTPKLKSFGINPIIYTHDKNAKELSSADPVIPDTSIYRGPFAKPSFFVWEKKLAPVLKLCREEKIDVIHAKGTYTAGFVALEIYKRLGIPYVVTSHSDILTTNSKRMRRKRVRHRCQNILKHAAFVTHLNSMMARASHELYDTRQKSKIIFNGIDYSEWERFLCLPEQNYLLAIGRLEKGKGFHIIIDMYADLIKQGFTSSLVIAGIGTEEENLKKQVKDHNLHLVVGNHEPSHLPEKSVLFTGYVRDDRKKRLIAQSLFVLFATQPELWEEAFGIVQLEAMAAGKSIAASDTQATRFLQNHGLKAMLVKPDDVESWVEQSAFLLQSQELRKNLGKANLNAVKYFDWWPIAKQYHDVYMECLEYKKI